MNFGTSVFLFTIFISLHHFKFWNVQVVLGQRDWQPSTSWSSGQHAKEQDQSKTIENAPFPVRSYKRSRKATENYYYPHPNRNHQQQQQRHIRQKKYTIGVDTNLDSSLNAPSNRKQTNLEIESINFQPLNHKSGDKYKKNDISHNDIIQILPPSFSFKPSALPPNKHIDQPQTGNNPFSQNYHDQFQPPLFNGHQQFGNGYMSHQLAIPSCSEVNGFSAGQIRLCQLYPDHVSSILQAAKLAAEECQYQFASRRWNCSLSPWGNQSSLLVSPSYMTPGSKEASVAKAFFSAAITYTTSRACREGLLSQCGCSRRQKPKDLPEGWIWGGCGDNTEYGFMFGVGFIDSKEREMNHPRYSKELLMMLSNTHNNLVGRRTVVALSKPGCKCHGVSGSCSLKTCWHQLPSFRSIGQELRAKYDNSAVLVNFNKAGTNLVHSVAERKPVVVPEEALRKVSAIQSLRFSKNLINRSDHDYGSSIGDKGNSSNSGIAPSEHLKYSGDGSTLKETMWTTDGEKNPLPPKQRPIVLKRRVYRQHQRPRRQRKHKKQPEATKRLVVTVRRPSKDELVYTFHSFNFCEPTEDGSWPGTQGRTCRRGSNEPDGCDLMCCGRGYNTFRTRTVERCNCQFVWCCHVQCSSCEKYTDVHVCK